MRTETESSEYENHFDSPGAAKREQAHYILSSLLITTRNLGWSTQLQRREVKMWKATRTMESFLAFSWCWAEGSLSCRMALKMQTSRTLRETLYRHPLVSTGDWFQEPCRYRNPRMLIEDGVVQSALRTQGTCVTAAAGAVNKEGQLYFKPENREGP